MTRLLSFGVAAVACAASFGAAGPAEAGKYCYRSARSYMLSCDYDTLAQCQASASGRSGDCLRDPWASAATAYAGAPMTRRHRRN